MVCGKCGHETPEEDATFCASCGGRLDGKVACGTCGGMNKAENVFCIYCGNRMDGKEFCDNCGVELEKDGGVFCPACGTRRSGAKSSAKTEPKSAPSAGKVKKEKDLSRLFGFITGGLATAAALMAFTFTFLIGLSGVADMSSLTGGSQESASMFLYYYFGEIYEEFSSMSDTFASLVCGDMLTAETYIYAIMGTVVSAATIVCVTAFFIPAVIQYVKFATRKSEETGEKWAVRALLAYLGGAATIYSLNYMYVSAGADSVRVSFNGATVAGIVLCGIFGGLWLASKFVSYWKKWREAETVKKAVCVVAGVAFAAVALALWQNMSLGTKMAESGAELEIKTGPTLNNVYMLMMFEGLLGKEGIVEQAVHVNTIYVCGMILQFVALGGIAAAVGACASKLLSTGEKQNAGLIWNILLTVISIIALVLFIVQGANVTAIMESIQAENVLTINYAPAIVATVFGVLSLAVSVVQFVFIKKAKEKENACGCEEAAA